MESFTAYRNQFTGKAYQTPEGCLKSEFDHLRDGLHVAVDSTLLLPWLDFDKQCDYLRAKIDALEAKGREYQQAIQEKGKVEHLPRHAPTLRLIDTTNQQEAAA